MCDRYVDGLERGGADGYFLHYIMGQICFLTKTTTYKKFLSTLGIHSTLRYPGSVAPG